MLALLAERLEPDFKHLALDDGGAIGAGVMITRDGAVIPPRLLPTSRLDKHCILHIMPIISGG